MEKKKTVTLDETVYIFVEEGSCKYEEISFEDPVELNLYNESQMKEFIGREEGAVGVEIGDYNYYLGIPIYTNDIRGSSENQVLLHNLKKYKYDGIILVQCELLPFLNHRNRVVTDFNFLHEKDENGNPIYLRRMAEIMGLEYQHHVQDKLNDVRNRIGYNSKLYENLRQLRGGVSIIPKMEETKNSEEEN